MPECGTRLRFLDRSEMPVHLLDYLVFCLSGGRALNEKKTLPQGKKVRGQVDILTNIGKPSVNLQNQDSLSNIFKLKV